MGKPKSRGNGQGTAIKRGNTWEARVVIGWKPNNDNTKIYPIQKTKGGFATKREALAYCPVLKSSYSRAAKSPTLEFYWNTYEKGEFLQLSDSKQMAYKIAWNRMDKIKYKEIQALTVLDLRNLVEGLTYYPARDVKQVLSHLFKLAGADRWVDKSLPSYIVLPKLEEKEREPFTIKEQEALWKLWEQGDKDAAIPLIMIYTGMMPGELRKLAVNMIDFNKGEINGIGIKTEVRRKSAIYLAKDIIPVLQEITTGKVGIIYPWTKDTFYKIYYAVLERAGCRKLQPYSCRHTTATALAVDNRVAPQTVKKIMRWASTKMLDRYAHPDVSDAKEAIEKINRKA